MSDKEFEYGIHRGAAGLRAALAALVACQAFACVTGGDGPSESNLAPEGGVCLSTCLADPGWKITPDCDAARAGIDRFSILDFESGTATNMYTYWDGTTFAPSFVANGNIYTTTGYQPAADVLPAGHDLCFPLNSVLHIIAGDTRQIGGVTYGGPLRSWGAGIGIPLQKFNGRPPGPGASTAKCNGPPPASNCPPGFRSDLGPTPSAGQMPDMTCLPDPCPQSDEFAVNIGSLDLSQYDGISFWARRGPNGQMGMRVLVGDKYTDDDLNFYAYRYNYQHPDQMPQQPLHCQRVRECVCRNQTPCQFAPKSEQATPALSVAFSTVSGPDPGWYCRPNSLEDILYLRDTSDLSGGGSVIVCGDTSCDRPNPAFPNELADGGMAPPDPMMSNMGGQDPQFFGRPCTPYEWPSGIATSYCFDPAKDPPPAPSTEMCGDHWTKVVNLSTEWQFYKVPFVDMRQQGWAKRSDHLDLTAASILRFTWDVGYIDTWIDDISFYRFKR